ncbi:MAG: dTMP kinase [Candidatus Buchananbacteria bacterium]
MFKNKYKGKFIAIEGIDGSGATGQVIKLSEYFHTEKIPAFFTQEPTNNVIGGIARGCLSGDFKVASAAGLQLLFAADRANHLEKEIIPALEAGTNVITKRYFLSSIAYGSVLINDRDWLWKINDQFLMPDLTILLKISAKTRMQRIGQNNLELNLFTDEESLQKVWENYEIIAKKYPNIIIVDADKSQEEVFSEVKNAVINLIKE